jgi:hypothetical protein
MEGAQLRPHATEQGGLGHPPASETTVPEWGPLSQQAVQVLGAAEDFSAMLPWASVVHINEQLWTFNQSQTSPPGHLPARCLQRLLHRPQRGRRLPGTPGSRGGVCRAIAPGVLCPCPISDPHQPPGTLCVHLEWTPISCRPHNLQEIQTQGPVSKSEGFV